MRMPLRDTAKGDQKTGERSPRAVVAADTYDKLPPATGRRTAS